MTTKATPKLGDVSTSDFGTHRMSSRSVSWNSSGMYLAIATSDRTIRLCTLEGSNIREILSLSGHGAPVERVRFHPNQDHLLCSAASDSTVRFWDVRAGVQQKAIGQLDLQFGPSAADISWTPAAGSSTMAVTERNGYIHVYDTRKLPAKGSKSTSSLKSFQLKSTVVETCIFSPVSRHLVGATTSGGYGSLNIWDWQNEEPGAFVYPAHTGPIYSVAFSPDGRILATGGSDAIVGLWDTESMVCGKVISRCTKFTRSVSFSHDSRFLASSSEADAIDLACAETGDLVGKVLLGRRGGADEISFHPKGYILACARCPSAMGGAPAAVTVAKLTVASQ